MSKRAKQNHKQGGSTAPAHPGKSGLVDPKKLVKISKEEAQRLKDYGVSIKMIESALGTKRAAFLEEEQMIMKQKRIEVNKRMLFLDELKNKYKIVGEVIACNDKTNELMLK